MILCPQKSPDPDSSGVVHPPSEDEIAAYGEWLGLSADDSDLMWIPRQALQTPIPTPWVECQTEEGDVFYFNSKTRESIWDHPCDSYYKTAISKFKAGECTKDELTELLKQDWLMAGADARGSVQQSPTPSDSARIVVSLPADAPPPGSSSPMSGRRRPSVNGVESVPQAAPARPRNSSSRNSTGKRERLPTIEEELVIANTRIAELHEEIEVSRNKHKDEVRMLTSDLLQARDYIDTILSDNKSLRSRMADAVNRVKEIQREALLTKSKLNEERRQRESAERRIAQLEKEASNESAPGKPSHILARLCGGSVNQSRQQVPIVRSQSTPTRPPISRSMTPTEDPYKDLMQLLATPPTDGFDRQPSPAI